MKIIKRNTNMKTLVIAAATAATLAAASAASANDLAFVGGLEYAAEAKVFEATAGVEYTYQSFTFTPLLTLNDSTGSFDLNSVELTVGYTVNPNINVYATVSADRNFNYSEATLGVAFRF
jgi:hypothetical protein